MSEPFFILCPLRSFSSLVCGMLGQHPDMYGMLELNLFQEDTLEGLVQYQQKTRPHSNHGLLRTLAQIHDGKQNFETIQAAEAWISDHFHWTTKQVLDHIITLVAPKIVIDKSPSTVMTPKSIERMYSMYPDASYLHLIRHPRSTGKSMIDLVNLTGAGNGAFVIDNYDPEDIWLQVHTNIVDFTESLAPGQSMRIKGEDLLGNPDVYLPQIAEWLGIRTDREALEATKHPETSPYACFGPPNALFGNDPNFLDNPVFRSTRFEEPTLKGELEWDSGKHFSHETCKLAKEFGYR